jgi:hypothetical protein
MYKPGGTVTIRWCNECGRHDRWQKLANRHFAFGKICLGTPQELTYVLKEDKENESQ